MPSALPEEQDAMMYEMNGITRRLHELSVSNADRGRNDASTDDARDRRRV